MLIQFLNSIGFSMITPMLPTYKKYYNCSSFVYGLISSSYGAAQFISRNIPLFQGLIILGKLSDRIGRKKILLISLLGSCAGRTNILKNRILIPRVLQHCHNIYNCEICNWIIWWHFFLWKSVKPNISR